MLNIFQYICEATGAVLATGALSEIFDGIKENVDACVFQNGHIDYDKLDRILLFFFLQYLDVT